ncbi:CRTAC1 family protein [Limnoglobus roseus]|uniref:CRTAC1 family protein n=1 Tax=Limnoglobus roseus TaxID=2598579 RepID=A0A5C1A5C6_9BACT|nr:CRTAC1 family protein [Limnoglobus roseus]QEL13525.1 CRTAC1 family protein [Limnoglobus roseus]
MTRAVKQIFVTAVFLGLLALAVVLDRADRPATGNLATGESLQRYGFHLTESAAACGLDFRHGSPTLDAKLAHIMPVVAAMGAGVSVVDFDGDGLLDLYAVTSKEGERNRLYRNRGDGTFEDVAAATGVADLNRPGTGVCMGAIWADYDNDGFPDLFVYKWGKPELFHNNRGQGFDRVTDKANLPPWVNANSACWLDYDRDGRLDLFVAGYWPEALDLWHLPSAQVMPESFEFAENGGRKYLLRNRGDGTFENVTERVGITSTRWTLGVVAADLCGTGYPDLVLANDYGVSEFYANKGGERFEAVGEEVGIGVTPKSGMNASLGDVHNRGQLAIYVSNITEGGNLVQGNNLWVPTGKTRNGYPRYANQAGTLNVERGGWSWGAKFGDLNNDGRLDLYVTNGYISAAKNKSYWYDYGKIAGGVNKVIRDAAFWPPIGDQSLAGYQQKCLCLNTGRDFTDVAAAVGVEDTFDGRAVALADLFNRGVLDVVVANQNGPLLLYKNTVAPGRDWVQFELTGGARPDREPGWSNRSAVGAQVRLTWRQGTNGPPQEQLQVVTAGDGYASQGMFRLHFGLGSQARVEKAVITWPSGRTQTVAAPATGTLHRVEEPGP